MNGDASVLIGVIAALGGDHVALAEVRTAGMDVTILQNNSSIAEDKVNSAGNKAGAIELTEGVDVEGVLVSKHVTPIKGAFVGVYTQSHRLMLRWPRRVLECDIACQEPFSDDGCYCKK